MAKSSTKTFTINGVKAKFSPKNCFYNRNEAAYEATKARKTRFARVVASGDKFCVYVSQRARKK